MSNKMPEKLINFRVYKDGNDLLGVADVDLPDLEAMTDTIKGAGIAGEVESPVLGHFGPMPMTINWRTVTGNTMALAQPKSHQLELRAATQNYDSAAGEYSTGSQKVVVKATPKKTALGKLDVGTKQDSGSEFECNYIKIWLDGQEKLEIDKYNFICVIDGVDVLADVRKALGL
ncbi:MAG: phage major tail tube protein [Desulfobacterales bacterium]|nr:phage major tail tube protein [Desulfobacterales bacterium]